MNPMLAPRRRGAAVALCCAALASAAHGGDHHRSVAAPTLPRYQQECAACHVAYPPGMLPAASWQRVMGNLARHFGTDASLDAATTRELSTYLAANAGTYRRVREEPPQDRITQSAWFVRKHDEVPDSAWRSSAVKTAANCQACHARANQGDFNEHRVRIPR